MKKLPKTIGVLLTPSLYKRSAQYGSLFSCPIATSLKEKGYKDILVGGIDVSIGSNKYDIIDGSPVEKGDNARDAILDNKRLSIKLVKVV